MYICLDCGKAFNIPKVCIETHGLPNPPYEESTESPCCGGGYTEAHECAECGSYIDTDYIKTKSGNRICENCYNRYELGDEDWC